MVRLGKNHITLIRTIVTPLKYLYLIHYYFFSSYNIFLKLLQWILIGWIALFKTFKNCLAGEPLEGLGGKVEVNYPITFSLYFWLDLPLLNYWSKDHFKDIGRERLSNCRRDSYFWEFYNIAYRLDLVGVYRFILPYSKAYILRYVEILFQFPTRFNTELN